MAARLHSHNLCLKSFFGVGFAALVALAAPPVQGCVGRRTGSLVEHHAWQAGSICIWPAGTVRMLLAYVTGQQEAQISGQQAAPILDQREYLAGEQPR